MRSNPTNDLMPQNTSLSEPSSSEPRFIGNEYLLNATLVSQWEGVGRRFRNACDRNQQRLCLLRKFLGWEDHG